MVYIWDVQQDKEGETWYHITCQYNDDGTLRARQGWISSKTAERGLFQSVVSVSAGNSGFLALREDGTVCGAARLGNRTSSFYRDIAAKPFFDDYKKRSFLLGREIEVLERGRVRPATARDLDPDFSLRVREADGRVRSLSSGEVRVKAKKG